MAHSVRRTRAGPFCAPRIPTTVPAETARPEPTPTTRAGGPAPAAAPTSGRPTASPKAKLPDPSRTAPPSASPRPLTTPAEPPPEPSEAARATPHVRHVAPGRGTPSHGLYWGDLTLRSCVGPNTGFGYLMRV
ncbi:hypothetical protein MBT84_16850 [Streptomyces sp. MBT84]|uniref:hypothetical protein n=1 Tax=Streptomyces sp. MBT84 TaxID=1488414 RepID=UPI001C6E1286|nr:hypothetical protein [Streptomyces sp. MBT84]MBW8701275.1 hypothetical protein [Streptomyces sp. MBT84]